MGAGAGGQVAAVLYQLHAAEVDFTVSLYRVLNGIPGLCECRGIQDYHIKLLAFLFQLGQQVEHIRTFKMHPVPNPVEPCVLTGLVHGQLGSIHAEDFLRTGQSGVQRKGTRVGEAVQYPVRQDAPAQVLYGQTVILLVQEETCLLAVLHIYHVADAVFRNLHLGVKWFADKSFVPLHAFLEPYLGITSFIYAADGYAVLGQDLPEHVHYHGFQPVNTQRQ